MKIGIFFRHCAYTGSGRRDMWMTCRAEGRSLINQAFGLSLMGHDVDLFGLPDQIDVIPGLSFVENYDQDIYYDFIMCLPPGSSSSNYGRMLQMIEPSNAIDHLKKVAVLFPRTTQYTLSSKAIPYLSENGLPGVEYFPFLFPIPCLPGIVEQDFLPFKLDIKKERVKIWVFINSWPNYHLSCDKEILSILRRLKYFHNLNLEVSLLQVGKETPFNTVPKEKEIIMGEFNAKLMYSNEMCYLDILNSIQESDICITKGGFCYCGNCSYDIVSLGKLLFYVTEGSPSTLDPSFHNINDLFPLTEFVISTSEDTGALNQKVDKIMSNPVACYDAMKKELKTYRFPEWSKIVTKILEENS